MPQVFSNGARGELAATITATDTTLVLSGAGSLFPEASVADGTWFKLVLQDDDGIEIVVCTEHAADSDSFTVTRGADNTLARVFEDKSIVGLRLLASDLDSIADSIEANKQSVVALDTSKANVNADTTGNAGSATKLKTARNFSITGGATAAPVAFDGQGNVVLSVTALDAAKVTTGVLAVANGGTGASTATGTGSNVLSVSPAITGTPTVPTATVGTNTTQAASTAFVTTAVSNAVSQLLGGAPSAALDTLKELGDALGNDPSFAATITNSLATKVDKVTGKVLSSNDFTNALLTKLNGIADGATAAVKAWPAGLTDINLLLDPGYYVVGSSAGAAGITNLPFTTACGILVTDIGGQGSANSERRKQMVIDTLGVMRARTTSSGSTGWSSWAIALDIMPTATSGQFLKFDGTNWVASADNNTTYSSMSASEATTGTATTGRVVTAAVLKTAVQTHAPTNVATADALSTAQAITFTGAATGTGNFDGSAALTINLARGITTGLVTSTTATGTTNVATANTTTYLNIVETVGGSTTTVGTSSQITGSGLVTVTSDTNGKITIAGANDATKLPLAGGALTGAVTSTGTLKINNTTASTSATTGAFTTTGGVGVGGAMFVTGAITSANNVTAYSDIRLKTNLKEISNALNKVKQLTGYTYTRIDTGESQTGLIAQDVQKVLPEAVQENANGILSVAYGNLIGLMVNAINELSERVATLEKEVM